MPYKDKDKQREYQRLHIDKKRKDFFSTKECSECSGNDGLAFYGAKRNQATFSFSRSLAKLEEHAAKYPILCISCITPKLKQDASKSQTIHGHTLLGDTGDTSRTYSSWEAMKRRCSAENADNYSNYGGRGIKVCESWLNFVAFLKDMGERPAGMTLDRINPNGNYEPSNCRWATPKVQANNRRNSKKSAVDL